MIPHDDASTLDSSARADETRDSQARTPPSASAQPTTTGGPSLIDQPDDSLPASGAKIPTRPVAGHSAERPGALIGRYKLLQQIGEGGFGSVFLAEQREPVVRKVALKIIKLGMDTRQVIARFEQERQALALMDHPHIAKVLDAGATDTGRPYFVMELCTGEAITQYCDRNNLSITARLGLFVQVCEAVQHAHQKGLIHRDIKPSNILVSASDGKPHAKVIDFGIAKAIVARLTEKTLFTAEAQFIGTPQYMSPEQAAGSLDIDTRTDVYSLGVLLYELLTGVTPFDPKRLRSAAHGEMQRIIREDEPARPSTRLSQNADTLASVAASRRVEPHKLRASLRGELDWIVMKALEKERQRRYETASSFAADVLRHLTGDPVTAAPPSAAYRFRKLVRRHKGAVAAAGCVAAALVLGLAGTIWQARVAADERDRARNEAARAVAAEAESRSRADELQRVADFQGQMLAQVDPAAAGARLSDDVRARFEAALVRAATPEAERQAEFESFSSQWSRLNATDAALELIDATILKPAVAAIDAQFSDQPIIAATLRSVLAERYHNLGLDEPALALQQKAVEQRRSELGEDHPDTINAIQNSGVFLRELGRRDEAMAAYREALEKSRRISGDDHRQTLVCLHNVGELLLQMGQYEEAQRYLSESLERRRRKLGEENPETVLSVLTWAALLHQQGKLSEAEPHFRAALASRRRTLGEDNFETVSALNNLGALLKDQGKTQEAVACFREVVDRRRRILGDVHPDTLMALQNLGTVLDISGQHAEAEALMREVLATQRSRLGPDHNSTLTTLGNLSVLLIGQNKLVEAEELCRETLQRRRRVLGPDHKATLFANNALGVALRRQNRDADAEPYWREALSIGTRVLGPSHPETLVFAHNLATLLRDQQKADEAEQLFREVMQTGSATIGPAHPTTLSATQNLGNMLLQQKRYQEAIDVYSAAEASARQTFTGNGERQLSNFLKHLGAARARGGQFATGESNLLEAHAIAVRTRGESHADTRACMSTLADFYALWDQAEPGTGREAAAAEWKSKLESAIAATQPAPAATVPAAKP